MKLVSFAFFLVTFLAFLAPARADEFYKCSGTVRALVAMSTRQIWTNVPIELKPFSAPSPKAAEHNAVLMAKGEVQRRETTVQVDYARMKCEEVKRKEAKPITQLAPVKITYKWRCWVKTTWHLGARSGTIERHGIEVDTEREDAEGMAMGLAILQVQERAKVLLFNKKDKPTWSQTDAKCSH
jgi:hypothetical protein